MAEKLTKDEKKALRKLEWQEKAKLDQKNAAIKKYSIWVGVSLAILLSIGGIMWLVSQPSSTTPQSTTVAAPQAKDISEGKKDAPVTIIEYADFQCPACAAYHPIVHQLLTANKDKIFYVYRMFPLRSIHRNAIISSQAGYAAQKQGAFFKYDDFLYDNQQEWADLPDPTAKFIDYAKSLKLDVNKFKTDMNSSEAKKYVEDMENQALNEGINATPTFIVNGNKIVNPNSLEEFQKIIDSEINNK